MCKRLFIEESKILFAFPRVMGLFLRSEAPGLVFSVTYPWGSFAPSAFSAYGGAAPLNNWAAAYSAGVFS